MRPINCDLTPAQVAGPIGKAFSRAGANASAAYFETGDALEHLAMAEQIDARADALLAECGRMLSRARRTADPSERQALMDAVAESLVQLCDLDELEEEHWRIWATERIVSARGLSLRTVELTERILTRRQVA